jgi:hypothetical protein
MTSPFGCCSGAYFSINVFGVYSVPIRVDGIIEQRGGSDSKGSIPGTGLYIYHFNASVKN